MGKHPKSRCNGSPVSWKGGIECAEHSAYWLFDGSWKGAIWRGDFAGLGLLSMNRAGGAGGGTGEL
jgi:hypothetical protein